MLIIEMENQDLPMILKLLRKRLDLTPYEMSNMTGVSVTQLNAIEQGARRCSFKTQNRIRETFGLDFNAFERAVTAYNRRITMQGTRY